MLLNDTLGLIFNAVIIDTKETKMCLYSYENGMMALMSTLKQPNGKVIFTTDEIYLHKFYEDKISLQFYLNQLQSTRLPL